jgi:hypothetical protein
MTTTPDFSTLEMGPCDATFKGTDLGLTQGGVQVQFGTTTKPVKADQYGESVIDNVIDGRTIKVTVPMAERDLTKLVAVFPGSTLVGTTTKRLEINAAVGTSLRALAGELVLHPHDRPSTDKSADLTVPLAMCAGSLNFTYESGKQRVYAVEFEGFVDLTDGSLFNMGDPAAA